MKQIAVLSITAVIALFVLAGCQESESNLIKRARLVGNENLKLKNQLAEKDKEIQTLKDEIAKLQEQQAQEHEQFGETTIKSLEMVAETQKQLDAVTAENEQLKEQLKQLQNQ